MTVGYNFDVSSSTHFSLLKILFRWRGSMWKLVIPELVVWLSFYFLLNTFVRFYFNDIQLHNFLAVREELRQWLNRIPLIFLLGFFVSVVFNRWVDIFKHIGFIDNLALAVSAFIIGSSNEVRLLRRNIVRYAVLSQTLVFRDISLQVRKRFPDNQAIVDSGLMTERERELYEAKEMHDSKYWLPIQWAYLLAQKARQDGLISCDLFTHGLIEKLREFRSDLQYLCCYDWVPVPLSYPQIVFMAVRCYFIVSLVARQQVSSDTVDTYFPVVTFLEFLFTVGWMKVAEELLNPFGEDDDDFECNYLIDRNLSTGFEIVELHERPPYDEIDDFWQMAIPRPLDVAVSDPEKKKVNPYHGSIADINVLRDKSPNWRKNSVFSVSRKFSQRSKLGDIDRLPRSSKRQPSISTARQPSSTNINADFPTPSRPVSFVNRLDSVCEENEVNSHL